MTGEGREHELRTTMRLIEDNYCGKNQDEAEAREEKNTTSRPGPTEDLQGRATRAGTRIGKSSKTAATARHREPFHW